VNTHTFKIDNNLCNLDCCPDLCFRIDLFSGGRMTNIIFTISVFMFISEKNPVTLAYPYNLLDHSQRTLPDIDIYILLLQPKQYLKNQSRRVNCHFRNHLVDCNIYKCSRFNKSGGLLYSKIDTKLPEYVSLPRMSVLVCFPIFNLFSMEQKCMFSNCKTF